MVEVHPLVHLAELDVADAVVDRLEEARCAGRPTIGSAGDEAGQVGAGVAGPLDQRVPGLAVGGDGGEHDLAVLVLEHVRLLQAGARRARSRSA